MPTLWNDLDIWLDNVDWRLTGDGGLDLTWTLPNRVSFGSSLRVEGAAVALDLWLRNGLDQTLSGLRTQLCVMLKGVLGIEAQTLANKLFDPPVAAVRSEGGDRWILTAWDRAGRCWGSPRCPCLHSDPVFPDCEPGQAVRLQGRLWFYDGGSIEGEVAAAKRRYQALPGALPQA